jgi:hypothetical protein
VTEIEELVERVDALEARLDEERARREELEAENEQLRERVDELEDEVDNLRIGAGEARAELSNRVSKLEDESGDESAVSVDVTPTPEGPGTGVQEPETPLEEVASLPETVVEESLKPNQQRARSVAVDIVDYAKSVPDGYSLTSSALRQVLTAQKDEAGKAYTQTVGRVIEYLDDLGAERVEVRETMSGQRVVVFDDELVKRLVAIRNSDNGVVAGEPVAG